MPAEPVRIVILRLFAADFAKEMGHIPHTLTAMDKQSDAEMAELLTKTDVLVSGSYKAAWRDPARCAVRLIHSVGAGLDGIDLTAVPPGCKVCNVYGHERGVAEQAFMHMLVLHKGLFQLDGALRKGDWTPSRPYLPEFRERKLLVVGLGHIGRELARWGNFLGMSVTVLTRSPKADRAEGLTLAHLGGLGELSQHLPDADFVVIAVPAAQGTVDLIGAKELGLMKPSAFLVNVGRGPVVNEEALYNALKQRRIAGAGLDVWWNYPVPGQMRMPSNLPFHELDNVVMTPHKPTIETMKFRWKAIAENIRRFSRGEELERVKYP